MKKDYPKYRKRSLLMIAVDAITVALAFYLCYYICRFTVLPTFQHLNRFSFLMHLLLIIVTYMPVMLVFGTYRSIWRVAQAKEYFICCIASVSAGFVYFLLSRAFFRSYSLPFYFYCLVMCTIPLGLITLRLLYRILRTNAGHGQHLPYTYRRTVIVGTGRRAMSLITDIENTPYCLIRPLAVISESADTRYPRRISSVPVTGCIGDIAEICRDGGADLVIAASDTLPAPDIIRAAADACCEISVCPDGKLSGLAMPTIADLTCGALLDNSDVRFDGVTDKRVLVLGLSRAITLPLARRLTSLSPALVAFAGSDTTSLVSVRDLLGDTSGCAVEYRLSDTSEVSLFNLFADIKPDITIYILPLCVPYGIRSVGDDGLSAAVRVAEGSGCALFLAVVPDNGVDADSHCGSLCKDASPEMAADAGAMRYGKLMLLPATDDGGGVLDCAMRDIRAGKTINLPFSGEFAAVCAEDEACLVLEALKYVATQADDGSSPVMRVLPGVRVNPEALLPVMARSSGSALHGVCVPEAVAPWREISADGLPQLVPVTAHSTYHCGKDLL